jgi:hypothetical protein
MCASAERVVADTLSQREMHAEGAPVEKAFGVVLADFPHRRNRL